MRASLSRTLAWRLLDEIDARRGRVLPPRRLRHFVGAGDFEAVGQEFLGYCVELASLEPTDRVLDVGCGIGRLALPFSRYLNDTAMYLGVDTWPTGIAWCDRHVATSSPNFSFRLLDVFDQKYNPQGRPGDDALGIEATSGSFDFATLIAILHLEPGRIRRYLGEVGRLLRPGGHYLGTWYLVEEGDRRSPGDLPRPAMSEGAARAMLDEAGIDILRLDRGQWDGRPDGLSYQDVIVGRRRELL